MKADWEKAGSFLLCGLMLAGAVAFYIWFQSAPMDGPAFLLRPVCWVTGSLSGTSLTLEPGIGYRGMAAGNRVLVDRTCSGGNFLVISFLLLLFTQTQGKSGRTRPLSALICLAMSYLFTLTATSLRISATFLLMGMELGLDPVLVHNVTGIATYLVFLCLCYLAACRLFDILQQKRTV